MLFEGILPLPANSPQIEITLITNEILDLHNCGSLDNFVYDPQQQTAYFNWTIYSDQKRLTLILVCKNVREWSAILENNGVPQNENDCLESLTFSSPDKLTLNFMGGQKIDLCCDVLEAKLK